MTTQAREALTADLRTISADMEHSRARLAEIAATIRETGKPYDQDFIDATQAGYHAFTAAKTAGRLAERIDATAAANLTPPQEPQP